MLKVEFNKKSENPFYGMKECLTMYQNASKGSTSFNLDAAWKECKTTEQKAMFFSLCFFIGDIPRQHNVFDGKVKMGGNAQRETFRDTVLPALWSKVKRMKSIDEVDFLMMVIEYTVTDNVFGCRVKTKKGTENVVQRINMPNIFGVDTVAAVAERLYRGTDFQKMCLAKFLPVPRWRGKHTKEVTKTRDAVMKAFCDRCNIPYEDHGTYRIYTGYKDWRKQHNKDFESVLFSTKRVLNMDREQFLKILNHMPASARHRVRKRLMNKKNEVKKDEYKDLAKWYIEWENYKEDHQQEARELEEKVRQGLATTKDKQRLTKVKKAAAVTTGGHTLNAKMFQKIINLTAEPVLVQSLMDKVNLPYNTLVIVDDSGSMNSGYGNWGFSARDFAAFMAAICMTKNPDDEGRSLLGAFSRTCRWFTTLETVSVKPNRLLRGVTHQVNQPFVIPTATLQENCLRIRSFLDSIAQGQMTYVAEVAKSIQTWVEQEPTAVDLLQNYPVWTLISDGNFNNNSSVAASLGELFKTMEHKVGFKPFVLLMDVGSQSSAKITQFEGLDNVLMVPPTPQNIEMILTNIKDMDIQDIYTPLQSLYRDNRYAPVRALVEGQKMTARAEAVLHRD